MTNWKQVGVQQFRIALDGLIAKQTEQGKGKVRSKARPTNIQPLNGLEYAEHINALYGGRVHDKHDGTSPTWLAKHKHDRETIGKQLKYFADFERSPEYKVNRLSRAAKADSINAKWEATLADESEDTREDLQAEFRAFVETEYSDLWRTLLTAKPEDSVASQIQSLVAWAKHRQITVGLHRGISYGDTALDFGCANASDKLIRLLAKGTAAADRLATIVKVKGGKDGKKKIETHPYSLPALTVKWLRRGIYAASGVVCQSIDTTPSGIVPNSQEAWNSNEELDRLAEQVTTCESNDTDSLNDLAETVATHKAKANTLMREASLVKGVHGTALRRRAQLAHLLAEGSHLTEETVRLAGFTSVHHALEAIRIGNLTKGILTGAGQDDSGEEPNTFEHRTGGNNPYLPIHARKLRMNARKLNRNDESAKLLQWHLSKVQDGHYRNIAPALRSQIDHAPAPIKPLPQTKYAARSEHARLNGYRWNTDYESIRLGRWLKEHALLNG